MKTNKSFSLEPRIYDCDVKINLSIPPETIPILIPQKSLQEIQKIKTPQGKIQDPDPYYSTEEILDITKPANGVIFTEDFWKSYLAVLKKQPIPGRKKGHLPPYSYETAENDFYTIGGKIEGNKVYLKIYIPPDGFETSNEGLIRDAKVGLLNFSVVSWTEDEIERDENNIIKSIKAVRSVKGERNDRVEPGLGAMKQKVNKADKPHKNNINKTEVYIMADNVYNEIIENLKNQVDNGTVAKSRICKDLGIEIVTDEQKTAIKTLKEIVDITGENPVEKIKQMKQNEETVKQQAYNNLREKLLTEEFGASKINVDGEEKDNLKRIAAEPYVNKEIQEEAELKKQIETAKNSPVVQKLSFQQADVNSNFNEIKIQNADKEKGRQSEYVKI